MTLLKMIENVIEENDTRKQIAEKIINKYPEYVHCKMNQSETGKKAIQQINAEISGKLTFPQFSVDKNSKPYKYNNKIVNDTETGNMATVRKMLSSCKGDFDTVTTKIQQQALSDCIDTLKTLYKTMM